MKRAATLIIVAMFGVGALQSSWPWPGRIGLAIAMIGPLVAATVLQVTRGRRGARHTPPARQQREERVDDRL